MLKKILPLFSSKGAGAKLTILIYHRVLEHEDIYREGEVIAEEFDWQMRLIANNFNVMKMADAVHALRSGDLPPASMCVTFDDGYADNFDVALPILKKWKLPATFFISTSFLNGGCMWNDVVIESVSQTKKEILDLTTHNLGSYAICNHEERKTAITELLRDIKHLPYEKRFAITQAIRRNLDVEIRKDIMMTTDQVRGLYDNGMEIGAHTDTHPILTKIEDAKAFAEIEKSKNVLESILGSRVTLFAYPNGRPKQDYSGQHVSMVKELGFDAAVSTTWGVSTKNSDLYQLPRFTPWDKTPTKFTLRLLKNYLR